MGDVMANISKGRAVEFFFRVNNNDPANSAIIVGLLASSGLEADSVLVDFDTLTAVVAGTTNEATNTGYARKVLTDADLSDPTPDDTNNWIQAIIADQSWTLTNDGTGNIGKLFIAYDGDTTGGTDANIIPISFHDWVVTPDGGVKTAEVSADGVVRAS